MDFTVATRFRREGQGARYQKLKLHDWKQGSAWAQAKRKPTKGLALDITANRRTICRDQKPEGGLKESYESDGSF